MMFKAKESQSSTLSLLQTWGSIDVIITELIIVFLVIMTIGNKNGIENKHYYQ